MRDLPFYLICATVTCIVFFGLDRVIPKKIRGSKRLLIEVGIIVLSSMIITFILEVIGVIG